MYVHFDFTRLIEKYSVECQLIRSASGGSYVAGNWVPATPLAPETITGAIIPMTNRKIYQSGGTYTEHDREFITLSEIPLEPEAHIVYKGFQYHVEGNTDYSDYADLYIYNLKRVGAFDRTEKH